MPSAQDVLRIAASQLGVTESPAGSNQQRYSAELHRPAEPWCADFVVWCMRQADVTLPNESAYTPYMATGFKQTARWHDGTAGMQPGDVVFFNFGSGVIRHVGIVEKSPDALGRVTTIEGNTSAGAAGSQDNGGGVYRRSRAPRDIVGYGRPNYTQEASVPDYPVVAAPISITMNADGSGYIILCADGGVFCFGTAKYLGRVHKV